jgi:hypothetical protein
MPNSRASAAFESPSATLRRNSAARVGDNDGFLPVYFPSLFAIAIPSRWRSRISSLSNSALCGAPHKAAWKATASALPRKLEPARAETAQTLIEKIPLDPSPAAIAQVGSGRSLDGIADQA